MKRYVFLDMKDAKIVKTDVVIAGCGIAGLYTALEINSGIKCILLNKSGIKKSNSMYAQGGVSAVIEDGDPGDSTDLHFKDTLEAGNMINKEDAVRVMVDEAQDNIKNIIKLGVRFDSENGKILLTREGGHSKKRILHCGGDATGLHITKSLYARISKRENIKVMNHVFLCDIITDSDGAKGVVVLDSKDKPIIIYAKKVVIATGGVGRIFRNSTNASCITGDGIAVALRAKAEISDMEFVQFHPTAMVHPSETGRYFLISEALRGEGGILRNRKWDAFMKNAHPLGDLAPRDIVSRAIIKEMKKEDIPNVYLDITHKSRRFLMERFPTIYNECMKRGIDIAKVWIPVMPVQHYFMGGIKVDIFARSTIKNLYSVGESSNTGVHGANRLASNSLLECIVFAKRCAEDINVSIKENSTKENSEKLYDSYDFSMENIEFEDFFDKTENTIDEEDNTDQIFLPDYDSIASEIRFITTLNCGIIRNEKSLIDSYERISIMQSNIEKTILKTKKEIEAYNMVLVAKEIAGAAIRRKESIGAHFRKD